MAADAQPLFPEALSGGDPAAFCEEMRARHGLNIGVDTIAALCAVLKRLHDAGQPVTTQAEALSFVTPVLAKTAAEQAVLREEIRRAFADEHRHRKPEPRFVNQAANREEPIRPLDLGRPGLPPWQVIAGVALVIGPIGIVILNGGISAPDIPVAPETQNVPFGSTTLGQALLAAWALLTGSGTLVFAAAVLSGLAALWVIARLHNLSVERDLAPEAADVVRAGLAAQTRIFFTSAVAQDALRRMAQHGQRATGRWDMAKTISRTIARGGQATLVPETRPVQPEFTVLFARSHQEDQAALIAEDLVAGLRDQTLHVARYDFVGTPVRLSCIGPDNHVKAVVSHSTFLTETDGHHVILVINPQRLFAMDGSVLPWVSHLVTPERSLMLLSPEPLAHQGDMADRLAALGIVAADARDAGLLDLIEGPRGARAGATGRMSDAHPWMQDSVPDAAQLRAIARWLLHRLSPGAREALAALTLYPELSRSFTRMAAGRVRDGGGQWLFLPARMGELTGLEWMRQGRIPDWARALVQSMTPVDRLADMEQTLREGLMPNAQGAIGTVMLRPRRLGLVGWLTPQTSQREAVVMRARPRSALAFDLPDALSRSLGQRIDQRWWLAGAAGLGLGAILHGSLERVTQEAAQLCVFALLVGLLLLRGYLEHRTSIDWRPWPVLAGAVGLAGVVANGTNIGQPEAMYFLPHANFGLALALLLGGEPNRCRPFAESMKGENLGASQLRWTLFQGTWIGAFWIWGNWDAIDGQTTPLVTLVMVGLLMLLMSRRLAFSAADIVAVPLSLWALHTGCIAQDQLGYVSGEGGAVLAFYVVCVAYFIEFRWRGVLPLNPLAALVLTVAPVFLFNLLAVIFTLDQTVTASFFVLGVVVAHFHVFIGRWPKGWFLGTFATVVIILALLGYDPEWDERVWVLVLLVSTAVIWPLVRRQYPDLIGDTVWSVYDNYVWTALSGQTARLTFIGVGLFLLCGFRYRIDFVNMGFFWLCYPVAIWAGARYGLAGFRMLAVTLLPFWIDIGIDFGTLGLATSGGPDDYFACLLLARIAGMADLRQRILKTTTLTPWQITYLCLGFVMGAAVELPTLGAVFMGVNFSPQTFFLVVLFLIGMSQVSLTQFSRFLAVMFLISCLSHWYDSNLDQMLWFFAIRPAFATPSDVVEIALAFAFGRAMRRILVDPWTFDWMARRTVILVVLMLGVVRLVGAGIAFGPVGIPLTLVPTEALILGFCVLGFLYRSTGIWIAIGVEVTLVLVSVAVTTASGALLPFGDPLIGPVFVDANNYVPAIGLRGSLNDVSVLGLGGWLFAFAGLVLRRGLEARYVLSEGVGIFGRPTPEGASSWISTLNSGEEHAARDITVSRRVLGGITRMHAGRDGLTWNDAVPTINATADAYNGDKAAIEALPQYSAAGHPALQALWIDRWAVIAGTFAIFYTAAELVAFGADIASAVAEAQVPVTEVPIKDDAAN